MNAPTPRFLICLSNDCHPASLEVRKIYLAVPDPAAEADSMVRVIDESGDDYLYSVALFAEIELPLAVARALAPRE